MCLNNLLHAMLPEQVGAVLFPFCPTTEREQNREGENKFGLVLLRRPNTHTHSLSLYQPSFLFVAYHSWQRESARALGTEKNK
jgi:hypothetical protein